MATTMLPPPDLLPAVLPTDRLGRRASPARTFGPGTGRSPMPATPSRSAAALLQTFGVVIAAGVVNTWWSYLGAFVLP